MEEVDQKIGKFKESEVEILVKLVDKYKNIIENKKTDATTWKEKQKTWAQITNEFNATCGSSRPPKNIKCKYDNLKKTAKKNLLLKKEICIKLVGGLTHI